MLLCNIQCDGCGRKPRFTEWFRAELGGGSYEEWRHPGIVFREMQCPIVHANRGKAARIFNQVFGHPMQDELSYLCPECQSRCRDLIPDLLVLDTGPDYEPPPAREDNARSWFGRTPKP